MVAQQSSVDVIVKPGEPVLVNRPCVVQVEPCEDGRGRRYRMRFLFVSPEDVTRAQAVRIAPAGSQP